MHLLGNRGLHKLCASQSYGIADPSADDSSTGRGVVLGRAATKLRSIETQPLTGGSTSRRLVHSSQAGAVVLPETSLELLKACILRKAGVLKKVEHLFNGV